MAAFVIDNAYVSVNSVDLSDDVESVTITLTTDTPESTAMGANARAFLAGLNNSTITVQFRSDLATSSVFDTLNGVYSGNAAVPLALRADAGAASATNEEAQVSAILTSWNPWGGSVGSVAATSATFQGTGDVTFATS